MDIENAVLGNKGLMDFCSQFGNDVYSKILMEVLLEGVMNAEVVFVSGEQEQEGDEAGDGASGRQDSELEADRSFHLEPPPSLGT